MDYDRLRSWLGLPPGPWPPDHYALLGLARGAGDFADIESRVLDCMELLRPHQLLHPELVTEGMNRLAQALVCLTDPVARAAYDRGLGITAAPFEVVEDELPMADDLPGQTQEVPFEPGLCPPGELQQPAYEVVWELESPPYEVVHYEVVEDAPRPNPPPLPAFEVVPPEAAEPDFLPPGLVVAEPTPVSRRAVYRRLAALRQALRAWESLRPVLGNPTGSLVTPVAVLLFVRALTDTRRALPGVAKVIRSPGAPGGTVAALVRLPHALHAVRVLIPSQRQAISLDWHRGHEALLRERARLRELAFVARPRHSSAIIRLLRELRQTPEWCLAALALVVFLFALFRRNS